MVTLRMVPTSILSLIFLTAVSRVNCRPSVHGITAGNNNDFIRKLPLDYSPNFSQNVAGRQQVIGITAGSEYGNQQTFSNPVGRKNEVRKNVFSVHPHPTPKFYGIFRPISSIHQTADGITAGSVKPELQQSVPSLSQPSFFNNLAASTLKLISFLPFGNLIGNAFNSGLQNWPLGQTSQLRHGLPVQDQHFPAPVSTDPSDVNYQQMYKLGGSTGFSHHGGPNSRTEVRDPSGAVIGAFQYLDAFGKIQSRQYIADANGFRVVGTDIPTA